MGKIYQAQQQLQEQIQEREAESSSTQLFGYRCASGLRRVWTLFSFKCIFVLIVSVALFLSAIFWLPPFSQIKYNFDANVEDKLDATVQAGFRLQKQVSLVIAHAKTLENDILEEIGVPNTKVSILSMDQSSMSNWTDVVFGVLPDPKNVPINSVSLSVLRSSLIELFLQQLNLSLTTSIFGQPSSFEILKFSGGITVIPVQIASIWQIPQILFNFTLNNSISQIQEYFDQLKDQLKFGLRLRPYENVYVQLTNVNGSTLNPPVIVQASVLSGAGALIVQTSRLKQLAQTITGSLSAKNLGLDHSVFGKVKEISLSSFLNHSLSTSQGSPTPSPSPSPSEENYYSAPYVSPYPAPSPSDAPVPSGGHPNLSPCIHCDSSSPSYDTFPNAPSPSIWPQTPLPPPSKPPTPSVITTHPPRHSPCRGSIISPSPVPTTHSDPSTPAFSPRAAVTHSPLGPTLQSAPDISPSPTVFSGSSTGRDKKSRTPSLASSPISPSPSSSVAGCPYREMWLFGLLGLLIFHLLCGLYC